eukprot:TRINITY_DN1718_c0_g1_i1.p1 TRINITY_DN1718_c0_g1~~TRINITY_DN1718_c0_g1_i1.p1  ORF type:complete len:165 (-),score=45.59 TRINITY_DN1718_c0_g1_i1:28-492(-)
MGVQVKLYDGRTIEAYVLEGQGNVIETQYTLRPSHRYLNLLRGSAAYGIDKKYFAWLNEQPAYESNCCGKFFIVLWLIFALLVCSPIVIVFALMNKCCGNKYPIAWFANKLAVLTFNLFMCCTCCSGASYEPRLPPFPKGGSDVFKEQGGSNRN